MRRGTVELPLTAERAGVTSLAGQISGQLRDAMTDGRLAAGERLPSTRALSAQLGVSRTVVTSAYAQLFAEGWIEGRHGSGTYVANGVPGVLATAGHAHGGRAESAREDGAAGGCPPQDGPPGSSGGGDAPAGQGAGRGSPEVGIRPPPRGPARAGWAEPVMVRGPLIELRPGIPWTAGIDPAAWRRAWRGAGRHVPGRQADHCGAASLCGALTGYLRRSRGVRCEPEQILVTRGVAGSLSLIAAGLLRPGDRVGIEEPGYPAAREVFTAHGARVVPCRADADGLVVDELPAGLRLVYTTPAHQYPLGGRLPVPRRQALVGWARATGALIVEDDYDGEFRYDVAPLPALFGLDPGVVLYLGTTTKVLTPALRIGWLVGQPRLVSQLAGTGERLGDWAAEPAQHAMLTLISTGDLERHIWRMRREYARRRAAMTAALGGGAGRLLGDEAGLHMVLRTRQDARLVAQAAWAKGVAVTPLAPYFMGPVTSNGLVLGYGGADVAEVSRGCHVLAGICEELPAATPAP